ncbi:MAG: hypothetical protein AAGH92_09450, partial [Planctomycetota bacterium]
MPKNDSDQHDNRDDKSGNDASSNPNGGPNKSGKPGAGNKPPQIKGQKALGWVLLVALVIGFVLIMHSAQNAANSITYTEFFNHARNGSFTDEGVLIKGDRFVGTLKEGTAGLSELENRRVEFLANPENIHIHTFELIRAGQDFKEDPAQAGLFVMFLLNWGPILLIAFLIYFFFFRALRSAGGGPGGMLGGFGRSKHKLMNKEHSTVTLDDVAGVEEAKEEVAEIIEFLKNPKKFQRLGGRVPRGVLL